MSAPFKFHKLNEAGQQKAQEIQKIFETTAADLGQVCGGGREWSLVMTKLEEACFFAKKSMAMMEVNQEKV